MVTSYAGTAGPPCCQCSTPLHAAWASRTASAPDASPALPSPSPRVTWALRARGPDIGGRSARRQPGGTCGSRQAARPHCQRAWPGGGRHGAVEDLAAAGERVSVQVRILDDHDRVLGRPGWARAA